MQKHINKIKTNLLEPGEAKDPDTSTVFQVWKAFANEQQQAEMRQAFADGIAWGEAKKQLFELINGELSKPRERYNELLANPGYIEDVLQAGAEKARSYSEPLLEKLRDSVGIRKLSK